MKNKLSSKIESYIKGKESKGKVSKEEVLHLFDEALKVDQNYKPALFEKGCLFAENLQFKESQECFNKILEFDPEDVFTLEQMIKLHKKLRQPIKAIEKLDVLIRLNSAREFVAYDKARILHKIERQQEALALYDLSISHGLNLKKCHYHKFHVLRKLQKIKESGIEIQNAIDLDPENLKLMVAKAMFLGDCGKNNESIQLFSEVLSTDPYYQNAIIGKSNILDKVGKKEEALETIKLGLAYNPDMGIVWNNKGNLENDLGMIEDAVQSFKKAIEMDSDDRRPYFNLGNLYRKQKDYSKSLINYQIALSKGPNNVESLMGVSFSLELLGNLKEALKYTEKAFEFEPGNKKLLISKAGLLLKLGKIIESEKMYKQVIEMDKHEKMNWMNLGMFYQTIGNFNQAIESFNKAIDLEENYKSAHFMKASIYKRTHKHDLALISLNKILRINPNDENAKKLIVDIMQEKEKEKNK